MTTETPKLTTKLRHVDIHQIYLRQQVQGGLITIIWVPTNLMVADGMTKILTVQAHSHFIHLLSMVDLEGIIFTLQTGQEPIG